MGGFQERFEGPDSREALVQNRLTYNINQIYFSIEPFSMVNITENCDKHIIKVSYIEFKSPRSFK